MVGAAPAPRRPRPHRPTRLPVSHRRGQLPPNRLVPQFAVASAAFCMGVKSAEVAARSVLARHTRSMLVSLYAGPLDGREIDEDTVPASITLPALIRHGDGRAPDYAEAVYVWRGRTTSAGAPALDYQPTTNAS